MSLAELFKSPEHERLLEFYRVRTLDRCSIKMMELHDYIKNNEIECAYELLDQLEGLYEQIVHEVVDADLEMFEKAEKTNV